MKPPAFQFYPDDFIGGTCDLSTEEVGAYIRLLCYQWGRGSVPIDDIAKLARIAGAKVTQDVMHKFPLGVNNRLEAERVKQSEYRAKQSAKGHASAQARFNRGSTVVQPSREPQGQPEVNSPSPSPSPSPSLIPDSISIAATKPQKPAAEGFEEFWQAYPNKAGKANALKVWNRDKPNLQTVLDALAWQKRAEAWTKDGGQFIPHASTYLNGRRYEDERPKPPPPPSCLGPSSFPKGHSFL